MSIQEIFLKPEKIVLIWNFKEEELGHKQIREITLSTFRQRRGRVVHLVVIHRAVGGSITLNNRLGSPKFLYDTLMNWWEGPSADLYSGYKPD